MNHNWVKGLIAAAAGGVTASFAPIYVDPDHFLMGPGAAKKLLWVVGIGAATHALAYVQATWGRYAAGSNNAGNSAAVKKQP